MARHILYLEDEPMPRPTPHEEVKLIEAIVAAHSNGIGIADIEAEFERRQDDKLKAPNVVQSSMGHASSVTLSRYTRSSAKRQFSEVAKVFGE